jgi:hypothetical protein
MEVVNEVKAEAWTSEFEGKVIIQVPFVVGNTYGRTKY